MKASQELCISDARASIDDLFEHRPLVYWTDLVLTLIVGYTAASGYLNAPLFSWWQLTCLFIAGFALFRAGSFIHEIVHLPGKRMRSFIVGWNILAGIPMLMPSFFYANHIDHHSTKHYGTGQDGEYLPLGSGAVHEIVYFFLQVLVLPMAILSRFLVVTPISLLHPTLRTWALERYSSYVINLRYRRQVPANAPLRIWAVVEVCCFLRATAMIGLWVGGFVPVSRVPLIYGLAVLTLGLNYIRNLVAHHYRSDGRPMRHLNQLEDSVNLQGMPVVTELFFPLGLRLHALHHLFPTLPYHNLPAAHHRLMATLPADSAYHRSVFPGFWSVAAHVVASAWRRKRVNETDGNRAKRWYARREQRLASMNDSAPTRTTPHRTKASMKIHQRAGA